MKKLFAMGVATLALAFSSCSSKDKAAQDAGAQEAPAQEEAVVAVEETSVDEDGYTTTPSGLKYKVLADAQGAKPSATDVVTVNYEGRLPDGTVFDSSYQRGEPAQFPLNRVIPGWTEGLQLMPVGSKYQFYIPSNLAYGPNGAGGIIGPNQDLIFDVELIAIN